jgi:hypothetical protein
VTTLRRAGAGEPGRASDRFRRLVIHLAGTPRQHGLRGARWCVRRRRPAVPIIGSCARVRRAGERYLTTPGGAARRPRNGPAVALSTARRPPSSSRGGIGPTASLSDEILGAARDDRPGDGRLDRRPSIDRHGFSRVAFWPGWSNGRGIGFRRTVDGDPFARRSGASFMRPPPQRRPGGHPFEPWPVPLSVTLPAEPISSGPPAAARLAAGGGARPRRARRVIHLAHLRLRRGCCRER